MAGVVPADAKWGKPAAVLRTQRSAQLLRSGALESRGRTERGVRYDPGSAKQRFAKGYALHRARETGRREFAALTCFKCRQLSISAVPRS
jgi:hypothetical protein